MIHIIYTYKGKVHSVEKNWTLEYAEKVLTRLGATYWEIGIGEPNEKISIDFIDKYK